MLVAGVAQLGLVWVAAARAGFRLTLRLPRLTPDMKRLAVIALPAMLAGGVVQINLLVGRQVGSFFDGAIAWLSYADRLYQLPLGVVGIAVGVVLLPDLSRRLRANDEQGGRDALSRAGEIALALTIPSAVALMVMPVPIVSVLFERGVFGPDDTVATALALAVYGAGLPAFVLQKVLQPLYFRAGGYAHALPLRRRGHGGERRGGGGFRDASGLHRGRHRHHAGGLGDGLAAAAGTPRHGRCGALRRPVQETPVADRGDLGPDGRGTLVGGAGLGAASGPARAGNTSALPSSWGVASASTPSSASFWAPSAWASSRRALRRG